MSNWRAELDREFVWATEARSKKNEGRARVCARRAAGIAIREHLDRRGVQPPSSSSHDLLIHLGRDERLPAELKKAIGYLTMRVNQEFKLPQGVDLIAEARSLCRWLLPDWE